MHTMAQIHGRVLAVPGFLLLLAGFLLSGCEEMTTGDKTRTPTAASLVGEWQIEHYDNPGQPDPYGIIWKFNRDGTFEARTKTAPGSYTSASGTWSLSGNMLTITVRAFEVTSTQVTAITVTSNKLCRHFDDEDGDICYIRI